MKTFICCMLLVFILPISLFGQIPTNGKNAFTVRSQRQDIYFYPASDGLKQNNLKILFTPGDGGWSGWAIDIAKIVSSWGYDIYGLDTRHYLKGFTGKAILKETDVMNDYHMIAEWIAPKPDEHVILIGWSEGAGLSLLAAVPKENKIKFCGLITFGLSDTEVLGWKWSDVFTTYLTTDNPDEPTFSAISYLPKVTPLPFFMINSTHDEYVTVNMAKKLFSFVNEPKQIKLVEAKNHHFDGNKDGFYNTLHEGLKWISETSNKKLR